MPAGDHVPHARRKGGLKLVRTGVWRVDVEVPTANGKRRRVSRTVNGTRAEAEVVLDELRSALAASVAPVASTGPRRAGRTKRSGAVTKLGPDRWLIGVEGSRDPVTGARRRHTQVVRGSKTDAEVALARLKLRANDAVLEPGTGARSVRAACQLYLREVRTGLQTQRTDRAACKRLCGVVMPGGQEFGDVRLARLDWRVVEQLFAQLDAQIQPATQVRYASTLSKVLEHAKRSGWVTTNAVRESRKPRVPSHRPDVPREDEVRDALERARQEDFSLYAYVLGMATTGCRRSELLALRVDDVDLGHGIVTIRASLADGGPGVGIFRKATKRDDWRDIPLTPQLVEVLTELFARRRGALAALDLHDVPVAGYVFSDSADGSTWWRPDSTTQRWLRVRGECTVTFAMLRRYVATKLLDATNGDYRTVASITGNSEETLRRWYDAGPNLAKKQAVLAMAKL
jgi:integrase